VHQNGALFRIKYMLIQPNTDLYDRIINKINREERLMILRKRLILNFSGLLISFFAFVPLTLKLLSDMAYMGFNQFLSLLFTDFTVVMANVGDYVLGLLESMPMVSLTLMLTTLLAFVFYTAKLSDSYSDFRKIIIN